MVFAKILEIETVKFSWEGGGGAKHSFGMCFMCLVTSEKMKRANYINV